MPGLDYETRGRGKPLLFLPGLGLNRRLFDIAAEALKEKRRSFLVDLQGTGASPMPDGGYGVGEDARLVSELVRDLPAIDVVAHSRGIKVLLVLSTFLKNVDTAMLVGGAGFGERDEAFRRDPSSFDFGKIEGGVEALQRLKRAMEGSAHLGAFMKAALPSADMRRLAAELSCRTVFVAGEHDPFLDDILEAMDCYKGSSLRIIVKAGHFPMIENPAGFNEILSEVL